MEASSAHGYSADWHARLREVQDDDVEIVVALTADQFQQLVRVALAESTTVGETARHFVLEGTAGWATRVRLGHS